MTPERYQQIAELYHAVHEAPAGERAALLAQADPELRREVESLLAERIGDSFGFKKESSGPQSSRASVVGRINFLTWR